MTVDLPVFVSLANNSTYSNSGKTVSCMSFYSDTLTSWELADTLESAHLGLVNC